jgi:DNA gyrase/topoisomerase IV subunit B
MNTSSCQDCETQFSAQTKEELLNTLYEHYMETRVDEAGKKA